MSSRFSIWFGNHRSSSMQAGQQASQLRSQQSHRSFLARLFDRSSFSLNYNSVPPPQSRLMQASLLRCQPWRQSFSQGISSQHAIFCQLSRSSLEDPLSRMIRYITLFHRQTEEFLEEFNQACTKDIIARSSVDGATYHFLRPVLEYLTAMDFVRVDFVSFAEEGDRREVVGIFRKCDIYWCAFKINRKVFEMVKKGREATKLFDTIKLWI